MSTYSNYPPPPPQQYYQAAPPPQHMYANGGYAAAYQQQQHEHAIATDPATFRHFYMSRLSSLTINSRPIIQDLSLLAMTHQQRMSHVVVQCIENHIRMIAPEIRLPSFYLLDSIAKNVFVPYAAQFTPNIASLFLDAYHQADSSNRSKMEEMLVTWRTGAPGGRELFGTGAQVAIERNVWGSGHGADANVQRPPNKQQVITELDVTLAQKERAVKTNPYDTVSAGHVDVLLQLRAILQTSTVSPAELTAILTQLRSLARSTASSMPPPPPAPAPSFAQPPPPPQQFAPQAPYPTAQIPGYPAQPQAVPPPAGFAFNPAIPPVALAPTSTAAPSVPNLTSLFSSLVKAGLVTAPVAGVTEETKPKLVDPQAEALKAYARTILNMPIRLTTHDLTRTRPQIVPMLYERLSLQCKQCAIRFPEQGEEGSKRMEDHLDMHFRQNRKASANLGRGHSRSWFVGSDNWMHDIPSVGTSKGKGPLSNLSSAKAAAAAAAEKLAQLRNSFVVVAPGEEAKMIVCPVCKEGLKPEFQEDEEEWVWKNAVSVGGKVYHATCHDEMSTSAARLRSEAGVRKSRSKTPEVPASRTSTTSSTSSSKLDKGSTTPPRAVVVSSLLGTPPRPLLHSSSGALPSSPSPARPAAVPASAASVAASLLVPRLAGTKRNADDVAAEELVEQLVKAESSSSTSSNSEALMSPRRKKIALASS